MESKNQQEQQQPHIFFFPFLAYGHLIPMIDLAKLCALRGVRASIVTTQLNVPQVSKAIQQIKSTGSQIEVLSIRFPAAEAGLPEDCENLNTLTARPGMGPDMVNRFIGAAAMLQDQLEQLLEQHRPACLVADMFYSWANGAAFKFGIPRLIFHGSGFFPFCISESLRLYDPFKGVASDSEPVLIPGVPGNIELANDQIAFHDKMDPNSSMGSMFRKMHEAESGCSGFVSNSFYELEPEYVECYRNMKGKKSWHVGPVALCNRSLEEKAQRGTSASFNGHECLNWLDSKKTNSVIYVCFGSVANFTASQLKELASALESSGHNFIWVVRKEEKNPEEVEDWLPEGFEERIQGKGLVLRGWAPQVLILEHEAVGGFVTHCGWNSTMEAIAAGKPMVTWPVSAEQFYNEKLLVEVLGIGVEVGTKKLVRFFGDSVKREAIEKAVARVMVGVEAEEMRGRASAIGEMARRAVAEGGSSYASLDDLIEQVRGGQLPLPSA